MYLRGLDEIVLLGLLCFLSFDVKLDIMAREILLLLLALVENVWLG